MTSGEHSAWMWAQACELIERAERLQRQFFGVGGTMDLPAWEPPVDMFETKDAVWLLAALPGVGAEDVSLSFDDDALIIVGERRLPSAMCRATLHRLEIPHGRFERRVPLPPGRYELASNELLDGLLMIGLRKR